MANHFGIFRESFTPVLPGVLKEGSSIFKGKGALQSFKKKALGDVSNTVSQKVNNTKPNEEGGKFVAESCSALRNDATASCKSSVKLEETKEQLPEVSGPCPECSYELGYDIIPKSERLSQKAIDMMCDFRPYQPASPVNWVLEIPKLPAEDILQFDMPEMPEDLSWDEPSVPFYDSDGSDLPF